MPSQPDLESQNGHGIDDDYDEKSPKPQEGRDFDPQTDVEKGEAEDGVRTKTKLDRNSTSKFSSDLDPSRKTSLTPTLAALKPTRTTTTSPSRARELSLSARRRGTGLSLISGVSGGSPDGGAIGEEEMVPHRVVSKEPDGTLLVGWEGDDDPEAPTNFTLLQRWTILLVIGAGSVCVTCASSMVGSTYEAMESRFNVSREVVTLGLSLFVAGLGIGPLFLGPLSERYGRNPIYRISFIVFTLFTIPVALAPNIVVFLIFRFLTGVAGSAFLSVAGGSVTDLFRKKELGVPMAVYSVSPFLGPVMGPVIAGFINQNTYWRWTWYVCLIWSGVQTFLLFLLVPETYEPALLKSKAKRLRKSTGNPNFKSPVEVDKNALSKNILGQLYIPFELLISEPIAFLLCLWTSILLGIIYAFFSAFPIVFSRHGFNLQMSGLSFLGVGLGFLIGTGISPLFQTALIRLEEKLGHPPGPEEHLKKAMIGGVLCPAGLFWFAFTTYKEVHWIVPIIATVFFGMGSILIFQAVFTFLVDAYRPYAASVMAGNTWMRCSFAAGFPLFTVQMYNTLHPEWASALCAFLCLAMTPLAFIFYRIGPQLRKGSKFSAEAPGPSNS